MTKPTLNRLAGVVLAAALAALGAAPAFANQDEVTTSGQAAVATDIADEPFALVGGDYGSQGFHHGLPETSIVPSTEPVAGDELSD